MVCLYRTGEKEMDEPTCIMPECPYCPTCEYGYVAYKDEDYDGYEPPTDSKWICMREVEICQDKKQ